MRKIKCDEVLNKSDFLGISDKEFVKQVERFCLDKMNEYEVSPKKVDTLKSYPEKVYEIFKLDLESQGDKIFVLETSLINYDGEEDDKEIYYSRIIAKRICDNMKRLNEDAAMKSIEAKSMFIDEIQEIEKQITQGVLEGGFFKSKINNLDYVCIGANTYDVHSPKERFSIKSVQNVWKLIWQILKTYQKDLEN